jgi:hypothetical protein
MYLVLHIVSLTGYSYVHQCKDIVNYLNYFIIIVR